MKKYEHHIQYERSAMYVVCMYQLYKDCDKVYVAWPE